MRRPYSDHAARACPHSSTTLTIDLPPSKQRKHGRYEFDGYAVQSTHRIGVSGSMAWVSSLRKKSSFSLCCVSSLPGHRLCTLCYLLIPVATGRAVSLHRGTQDCTSRDKVLSVALRKVMCGILYCVVGWIVSNSGNILADSSPTKGEAFQNVFVILRAPLCSVYVYGRFKLLLGSYHIITATYSQSECVFHVFPYSSHTKTFQAPTNFLYDELYFWVKFSFIL